MDRISNRRTVEESRVGIGRVDWIIQVEVVGDSSNVLEVSWVRIKVSVQHLVENFETSGPFFSLNSLSNTMFVVFQDLNLTIIGETTPKNSINSRI